MLILLFTFTNSDLTMIFCSPKLDLHRNQEPLKRYLDEFIGTFRFRESTVSNRHAHTYSIKHHRSKHQTWGLDIDESWTTSLHDANDMETTADILQIKKCEGQIKANSLFSYIVSQRRDFGRVSAWAFKRIGKLQGIPRILNLLGRQPLTACRLCTKYPHH